MKGFEERELGSKIMKKGYEQISINEVISHHFEKAQKIGELTEKAHYFIGVGQFLRIHLSFKNVIETTKRYYLVFITQLLILLFVFGILHSLLSNTKTTLISLIIFYLFIIIILAVKQRNSKKTILFIYSNIAKSYYFFKEFLMNKMMINNYPLDVDVVK